MTKSTFDSYHHYQLNLGIKREKLIAINPGGTKGLDLTASSFSPIGLIINTLVIYFP